jgi:hypothetical protein
VELLVLVFDTFPVVAMLLGLLVGVPEIKIQGYFYKVWNQLSLAN